MAMALPRSPEAIEIKKAANLNEEIRKLIALARRGTVNIITSMSRRPD
jgi:hypothetical protein